MASSTRSIVAYAASVPLFLAAPAPAMLPHGQFGSGTMQPAATVTIGTASASAWWGNGFTPQDGYAELTANAGATQTRAMLIAVPMPAAGTYNVSAEVWMTSHTRQTAYWHVLAVADTTILDLGNAGIPLTVTQAGVKSLTSDAPPAGTANGVWRAQTKSFTISTADAAAYHYVVFAFVGSQATGDTLRFRNINSTIPWASTLTDGLDAVWVTSASGLSNLSQVNWSNIVRTSKEPQINWPSVTTPWYPRAAADRFGVKLTGTIRTPSAGLWNFRLGGDDGCQLRINGSLVVNHDGLHSYNKKTGAVNLTAGTHTVEVVFFENSGHAGLTLEWASPGTTAYSIVPSTAYRARDPEVRIVRWREAPAE
ncbi:MAG: hypothetical protein J0L61_11155 [Planctomycetes bacterium]|nr:hypothetical protein [Planctomycetota bacterium]